MKRVVSILMVAMMATALTGCKIERSTYKPVEINMAGNEPIKRPSASAQTTSAQVATQGTGSTATTVVNATEPLHINGSSSVGGKRTSIVKGPVTQAHSTKAEFIYQGRRWTGTLVLGNNGFVFTPDNGEVVTFPLNVVLLVTVDSSDAVEALYLTTANGEFEFNVEKGYGQKISSFIIITEKAKQY